MSIITRWFIVALSFLLAAYFVPGITVESFYTALVLAFAWGIAGLVFKPILVFLTLPINIMTLGLFTFVINGLLFWFLGTIIKGFHVSGFFEAFLGALIVTLTGWFGNKLLARVL